MAQQQSIQGINWETFTGIVTLISPLAINAKNGRPSQVSTSETGERYIFQVEDGVFSHLVTGRTKVFARMIGGKLEKLSIGWRDTIGDFIVTMMFPEVLAFRNLLALYEAELADPPNDGFRPPVITDRLRELASRETASGVDLSDFSHHYMFTWMRDKFTTSASLDGVRFVVRRSA